MADINKTIKELEHKKDVDSNLAFYGNYMMSLSNRLAYIKAAMNAGTLFEMNMDIGEDCPELNAMLEGIWQCLSQDVLGEFSGQQFEQAVEHADTLRKSMISDVKKLTAYADRLQIYEYVLNRMEYRFKEDAQQEVNTELFSRRLLTHVLGDSDRQLVNLQIQEMVGQLPLRMTKARFYNYLQDALSLYNGADSDSLEDFLYMLESKCMLSEPEGFGEGFEALNGILDQLEKASYKELDQQTFVRLQGILNRGVSTVTDLISIYMLAAEVINQLYAIILSTPYAMTDVEERDLCRNILSGIVKERTEGVYKSLPDEITELYYELEGRQENLMERYDHAEYMLDEIRSSFQDLLSGLMLDKIYESLYRIQKLLSTSLFVEFSEDGKESFHAGHVDSDRLEECFVRLTEQFDSLFSSLEKPVMRAVMASALSSFPVFFQSADEIEQYIRDSLDGCRDSAERAACMEILNQMMNEA